MEKKSELALTSENPLRAVLVAVSTQNQPAAQTWQYLDELSFLAKTIHIQTAGLFTQNLKHPEARTYIGKGKLQELQVYVQAYPVEMIIFDDQLSPLQFRNLEKALPDQRILDRGLLILEVFDKRAATASAKLQVQLARLEYLYPRLARNQAPASKQGDTGKLGRTGETELANSRKMIKDRIVVLKEKLEKINTQHATQGQQRNGIVRVTLVGYTNVGKSSLMRHLSKADVYIKDELFATVESTVRRAQIDHLSFLLTDTVGFIRKLPEMLIDSFKSTLDQVRQADILLHVADVSHPACQQQIEVVRKMLVKIGAGHIPTLLVYNKIDLMQKDGLANLDNQQATDERILSSNNDNEVFISIENNDNLQNLQKLLAAMILERQLHLYPLTVPALLFDHRCC